MYRTGTADLPLHGGRVPPSLFRYMTELSQKIVTLLVELYGTEEFLRRISDPFWFQSFGALIGMDWHSSGVTVTVLSAIREGIRGKERDLGLFVCGGKGKMGRETPRMLMEVGDRTGLEVSPLISASRLTARVDTTLIQDGSSLYLHFFLLDLQGRWAVVQQGMKPPRTFEGTLFEKMEEEEEGYARRYHWLSEKVSSFHETPHTGVVGEKKGEVLNLTIPEARSTKEGILTLLKEVPRWVDRELPRIVPHLKMPRRHPILRTDIDPLRFRSILLTTYERNLNDFTDLLLSPGLGSKAMRALVLTAELLLGTPPTFSDPARFSFAHGGKDGHPYPVDFPTYRNTIEVLKSVVEKIHLGQEEKRGALRRLHRFWEIYSPVVY
jgi:hypothetical protein